MAEIIKIKNSKRRLESKIQKESVIDYARKKGMIVFKIEQANTYGIPDICIIYKGITCFLEVKSKKGNPSKAQMKKLDMIAEKGGGNTFLAQGDSDAKKFIDDWEEIFNV